jgi:hypothetical protein
MAQRFFSNTSTVGQLTSPVAGSATTLTTSGLANLPTVPFTITLDRNTASEEICLVTAVVGANLTVTRGYDGTAQQTHAAGAPVEHTAGAIDFSEASAHTNATTSVHGTTGSLVGTSGSQTVFGKTIVSPLLQASTSDGDGAVLFIPTGVTRNMVRGVDAGGVDRLIVDNGGNLTAQSLQSTAATTVHGTLTVQGATTTTGVVNLNNGATVPTGKDLTLTDAPGVGTDAVNKTYADALGTAAPTASTIVRRDTNGRTQVAAPNTGVDVANKAYVDGKTPSSAATYRATASKSFASGAASSSLTWTASSGATGVPAFMTLASTVFTVVTAGVYALVFRADSDAPVAGYSVAAINISGAAGGVDPAAARPPGAGEWFRRVGAAHPIGAGDRVPPGWGDDHPGYHSGD